MTEREEMLWLADRLDAWAIPVSSGQGAALAMRDAANALRSAARTGPDVAGFEAVDRAIAVFLEDDTWKQGGLGIEDKRRRMRAAIAALPTPAGESVTGWQPIATAPKDNRCVLIAGGTFDASNSISGDCDFVGPTIASYDTWEKLWKGENAGGHDEFYWHKPTHWMPLPTYTITRKSEARS